MHLVTRRPSPYLVVLALAVLAAFPAFGKRRSVGHSSNAPTFTATINGTVLDAVTGRPVIAAKVQANERSTFTDANGRFTFRNFTAYGPLTLSATRTGYVTGSTVMNASTETPTIRLQSGPLVTLRQTDSTELQIDADSIEFGYAVPFSGYLSSTYDDFCRLSDHVALRIDRSEMKKITGPSTFITSSGCCNGTNQQKLTIQTKTASAAEMVFVDSCEGYKVDFIGREHVTGKFVYIPFGQITEVVFP